MSELEVQPTIKILENGKVIKEIGVFRWVPKDREDCVRKAQYLHYKMGKIELTDQAISQVEQDIVELEKIWRDITGKRGPFAEIREILKVKEA